MSQSIQVNGQTINYPETGDTNWADDATNFAIQTSAALGKIGLSSGTSVDITQTLDVTGNTTLDANLSVGGNASVTGNLTVNGSTQLGNANIDTIGITGIVNVDSGVLYVDPVNNRVGINDTTPSEALDVNGNALISGTLGVTGSTSLSNTLGVIGDVSVNTNKFNITASSGNTSIAGTLGVTGDVAINTNKFNVTASSGNTTIAGTLEVTGNTTVDGVIFADDNTTANTPVISFTGDTNTGIGRSGADTLDFITNGNSRFRIETTGQIKAVYESQVGTDYNTQLDNGYLCRAWVNFNGTGTVAIRASGNVSSITDNGTGDYTINFTTAMPDVNYAVLGNSMRNVTGSAVQLIVNIKNDTTYANSVGTSSCRILTSRTDNGTLDDPLSISIGVFR